MDVLSFISNLLGLVCVLLASLIKGERIKTTLFFVCLGNVLIAAGYLFAGNGFHCAASGLVAGVLTVINFFLQSKGRPLPRWLIAVYAPLMIAVNLLVGDLSRLTLLAVLACMAFVLSIFQANGRGYRLCVLFNTATWSVYDALSHAWNGLATHVVLFAFTLLGALVWDRKSKQKGDA